MEYPSNCIKGIPNDTYMTPESTAGSNLFFFKGPDRGDGWTEQSINWEDNADVIQATLRQQRRDGEVQFAAGLAILATIQLDQIAKLPIVRNRLSYERSPILPDQPYHGNILLKANTPDPIMKQIAGSLALSVNRLIPPMDIT